MEIPLLAAGDFGVALVALMACAYEASLLAMRGRHHGHGWAAGIAAGAALDCICEGIQYTTADPTLVVTLLRLECISYLILAICIVGFVEDTTRRRFPLPRWLTIPAAALSGVLVVFTDVIVQTKIMTLDLLWLDRPFLQPVPTAGMDLYFASLLVVCGAGTIQLTLRSELPAERRIYGLAMTVWLAAAAADALVTLGVVASAPMLFLDYGFFLVAISLMAVDVARFGTLLRESERSRAQTDQSFHTLVERLPLMALVVDHGRVVQANAAAGRLLLADPPQSLVGQAVVDLLHPEDRASVPQRLQLKGAGVWEARFQRSDGATVVTEVAALPLRGDGETVMVLLALDVTAQRQLTARMMSADRMAAVGTLAAGVAHEINNPMTYVATNLDVAQQILSRMGEPGPSLARDRAELRALLDQSRDGALRVRRIVRDLTMLSREDAGGLGPVDLAEVLRAAQQVALSEIRYRALHVTEVGPLPTVTGDGARLGQVFLNLLVNAAQAIPRGNVSANEVRVTARTDAEGWAVVEIHDTGSGIAPEHRARVFDPFFTTKPLGQGTGLGLSLCQGIVLTHGGTLEFDSVLGRGTTFRVRLPGTPPQPGEIRHPVVSRPLPMLPRTPRPHHRRRVLIIDDEPRVGESLCRFLGRAYQAESVTSARIGLDRLAVTDPAAPFDAILCDLMMPDMTGIEFFIAVTAKYPEMAERIVFLTGGAFTQPTRTWLLTVTNPCLEKPPELEALQAAIEQVSPPGGPPRAT